METDNAQLLHARGEHIGSIHTYRSTVHAPSTGQHLLFKFGVQTNSLTSSSVEDSKLCLFSASSFSSAKNEKQIIS